MATCATAKNTVGGIHTSNGGIIEGSYYNAIAIGGAAADNGEVVNTGNSDPYNIVYSFY